MDPGSRRARRCHLGSVVERTVEIPSTLSEVDRIEIRRHQGFTCLLAFPVRNGGIEACARTPTEISMSRTFFPLVILASFGSACINPEKKDNDNDQTAQTSDIQLHFQFEGPFNV